MIFAIKPFEIHDGDGIRTTVFFKGCPLRCKWCHNPESLSPQKEFLFDHGLCKSCGKCVFLCNANILQDEKHYFLRNNCTRCGKCVNICPHNCFVTVGQDLSANEIAEQVLKDEIFMKGSGGGVTFSGGEPLMQVDLCIEIATILKEKNINLAIDTCGAVSRSTIDRIIPFVDTFLFDIKAIDEAVHKFCTGISNKQILENIKYVDSLGIPMEIRYPYVPTMNDGEVERVARFVKDLKNVKFMRVLPYHNYAKRKYECLGLSYPLPHVTAPEKSDIEAVAQKMRDYGLKNVVLY
jgi:pyruvate formate lyase activating enzyme